VQAEMRAQGRRTVIGIPLASIALARLRDEA
jgi:hypothetical protein